MTHQRKTIRRIDRRNNSTNGNPRFWITFTDYSHAHTAADAAFSYEVGNPGMREGCEVEVFYNERGMIAGMSAATTSAVESNREGR